MKTASATRCNRPLPPLVGGWEERQTLSSLPVGGRVSSYTDRRPQIQTRQFFVRQRRFNLMENTNPAYRFHQSTVRRSPMDTVSELDYNTNQVLTSKEGEHGCALST